MKRIAVFILLLLPFIVQAQAGKNGILLLTKDSLAENKVILLEEHWKYKAADSMIMADSSYDDSKWESINPGLYLNLYGTKKHSYDSLKGICWFRRDIYADSAIVNIPLALLITHMGASEVYVDGKLVKKTGVISDKAHTEYYDPQEVPVVFTLTHAGRHVIAIRYANFDVQKNAKVYGSNFAGLRAKLGAYNSIITQRHNNFVITSFLFTLLLGAFIALSLTHLLLFFYNRREKSNLYYSFFCFSLAILFFITWSNYAVPYPSWQLVQHYTLAISFSGLCIALSGFINDLFSKKKIRFIIVCVASIVVPLLSFVDEGNITELGYFFLFVAVSLEAIILTVVAIYRKVKGARIIGAGILLFALFIFLTSVYASVNAVQHNDINLNGTWLALVLIIAILSIPVSMSLYLAWKFATINKELKNNLEQVKTLSEQTIRQEQEKKHMLETQNELLEREVVVRTAEIREQKSEIEKQHDELKKEKEKSDTLLLNILPEEVAAELKDKGHTAARSFNDVTVLFTDFVDFTKAGERMSAQELVDELHICFKTFDEIISRHKIEKIKTIGDAYLAVSGLPISDPNHAVNMVTAALEIQQFMAERKSMLDVQTFEIRIGIHSGSVVAGIVGIKKFAYDIWGDAVNTAARMEQSSEAGKINISENTYQLVKDGFICTYRGAISAKNKGDLNMYFVEKRVD